MKGRFVDMSRKAFRLALLLATVAACAQLFSGHRSAQLVAECQPAKLAAFEGHYDSLAVADLYLFGMVNEKTEQVSGLAIPKMLTFLVHEDFVTPVPGLHSIPKENRPTRVNFVFQTYHAMVAIGMMLIGLTLLASFLLWRKKLYRQKWLLQLFVPAVLLPQIANQVGWYSAEVGRQPWVVLRWWRLMWDINYSASSVLIAGLLGLMLGNVVQGIAIGPDFEYKGSTPDFFNPCALLTGLTTIALFAMHGAIYLVMKTENSLHARLMGMVAVTSRAFVSLYVLLTMATLIFFPEMADKFRHSPVLFGIPVLAVLFSINVRRLAEKRRYRWAFVFSGSTTALLLVLVAIGLFPVVVPSSLNAAYDLRVRDSASTPGTCVPCSSLLLSEYR